MEGITTARVLLMVEPTMGEAISTQAVVVTTDLARHTAGAIAARDLHTMEITMGEATSTQAVAVTTDLVRLMEEGVTAVQDLQTKAILLTKVAISTQAVETMDIHHTVAAMETTMGEAISTQAVAVTTDRDHLTVGATADLARHMKKETGILRTTMAEVTLEADTPTSLTTVKATISTITIETDGKVTSRWKGTRTTVTGEAIADIPQLTGQLTVREIHMKATLEADLLLLEVTTQVADHHPQEAATPEADRHLAVQALEASLHLFPVHAQKLLMLDFPLITLPARTMAIRLSARLDAKIGN